MTREVAIVGAGPAGLMAAEMLAKAGMAVTIYERMANPARKFLMAGRGGLNLTHSEPLDLLLSRYAPQHETLLAAVRAYPPDALRQWSAGLGEETFVGSSGRVFPKGFKASPLLRAWLGRLDGLGVTLKGRHRWMGFAADGALLFDTPQGAVGIRADATLFALGGASWPKLGSDGAWVAPFKAAGVAVEPLEPANCGFFVNWSAPFRERFAGSPLKPLRLIHGETDLQGEALITATGIEGGGIYALSRALREAIKREGHAALTLDLRPHQTAEQLAAKLARPRGKQSLANHLRRSGLDALTVGLLREATDNRLPDDAAALARLIKALPLTLTGIAGLDRAISTAGGVSFDSLDEDFMLRALPGCFVAGEMLDYDAPTGGYLLQAAFSTGVAAAGGILRYLEQQ